MSWRANLSKEQQGKLTRRQQPGRSGKLDIPYAMSDSEAVRRRALDESSSETPLPLASFSGDGLKMERPLVGPSEPVQGHTSQPLALEPVSAIDSSPATVPHSASQAASRVGLKFAQASRPWGSVVTSPDRGGRSAERVFIDD